MEINSVTHSHPPMGGFEKKGEKVSLLSLLPLTGARKRNQEKEKAQRNQKKEKINSLVLSFSLSPPLSLLPSPTATTPPHTARFHKQQSQLLLFLASLHQTREGYSITLTPEPSADGGRFLANLALTAPAPPCALVTRPQITRNLVPRLRVLAL